MLRLDNILTRIYSPTMLQLFSPESLQHMIQIYGLWILLAFVMLESMGMPVPGETVLIAAALYAGSTHAITIRSVILVAAFAASLGDNIGYLVGRTFGLRYLTRYGKFIRINAARLQVGRYLFLHHGGKIVFWGRYVAFLRTFSAILAGVNRMPWRSFLFMNALGGVTWASLFGMGAYYFGEKIHKIAWPTSLVLLITTGIIIAIGTRFYRRHERELEQLANAELSTFDK